MRITKRMKGTEIIKIGKMENNELNKAIYLQLLEAAKEVFPTMDGMMKWKSLTARNPTKH